MLPSAPWPLLVTCEAPHGGEGPAASHPAHMTKAPAQAHGAFRILNSGGLLSTPARAPASAVLRSETDVPGDRRSSASPSIRGSRARRQLGETGDPPSIDQRERTVCVLRRGAEHGLLARARRSRPNVLTRCQL